MQFQMEEAMDLLRRTPVMLEAMLSGLSDRWTKCNEGDGTWSTFDVVGHLIDGERNDWMERVKLIHSLDDHPEFKPFDRFEHLKRNHNRTLEELLIEFKELREKNLKELKSMAAEINLDLTGIHPSFGKVTMQQLLATWVVHDLNHISQISRVMANRYKKDVGPWKEYLRIIS